MELMVGEQRPGVAVETVGLADEEPQTRDLTGRQDLPGVWAVAGPQRLRVAIESRRPGRDAPLKRLNGLAQVNENAGRRLSVVRGACRDRSEHSLVTGL